MPTPGSPPARLVVTWTRPAASGGPTCTSAITPGHGHLLHGPDGRCARCARACGGDRSGLSRWASSASPAVPPRQRPFAIRRAAGVRHRRAGRAVPCAHPAGARLPPRRHQSGHAAHVGGGAVTLGAVTLADSRTAGGTANGTLDVTGGELTLLRQRPQGSQRRRRRGDVLSLGAATLRAGANVTSEAPVAINFGTEATDRWILDTNVGHARRHPRWRWRVHQDRRRRPRPVRRGQLRRRPGAEQRHHLLQRDGHAAGRRRRRHRGRAARVRTAHRRWRRWRAAACSGPAWPRVPPR
jgi:hypothetical protein